MGKRTGLQRSLVRAAWLALVCLPALAVTAAWFLHRWAKLGDNLAYVLGAVGNLCALVGLPALACLVLIGVRFSPAERVFGLDRMLRLHKVLGSAVVALYSAHAILRFLKATLKHDAVWQWQMLCGWETGGAEAWGMNAGRIGLTVLLIAGGLARLGHFRLVSFHAWKPAHLFLYIAIPSGLVHARIVGDDLGRFPYGTVWLAAVAACGGLCLYRIACIARRNRCSATALLERQEESAGVHTYRLQGGILAPRQAGQFCLLRYRRGRTWSEPRPFTISAGAQAENPAITVKSSGAFTAALAQLPPGTALLCEGPYGRFCPSRAEEPNIVMIAGGIGVTPFLSIIRTAAAAGAGTRLTLLWNTRSEGDVIARTELERLAACGTLTLVHVLSREIPDPSARMPGVAREQGHITADMLTRHTDPHRATFYLCGPRAMQRNVLRELRTAFGVAPRQVRRELFFW